MRQGQAATAGGGFQRFHVVATDWAGASWLGVQNFFQRQNPRFRYKHSTFTKSARGLCAAPVMRHRLLLHVEFKTKWRPPVRSPIVKGRFTNGLNDLRGLAHVIKTLAGLLVNVGRRVHPGRLPESRHKITKKVRKGPPSSRAGLPIYRDTGRPQGGPGHNKLHVTACGSPGK